MYFSGNVSILSSFQIYCGIAIYIILWLYFILWLSLLYHYKFNLCWVYSISSFYPTLFVLAFPFSLSILIRGQSNLLTFSKNEILFLWIFSFVFLLTYFYPYFCYFHMSCYGEFAVLYFYKVFFFICMIRSFFKYSKLSSYCCLSSQHPTFHTHILGQASLQFIHGFLTFLVVFHFILLSLLPGMPMFLLRWF